MDQSLIQMLPPGGTFREPGAARPRALCFPSLFLRVQTDPDRYYWDILR